MKYFDWLKCPHGEFSAQTNDREVTIAHAEIIQQKPFLKKLYVDFYKELKKAVSGAENKTIVELGSGGGFIKKIIPNAITSDILDVPNADKIFSACAMPLAGQSVDAFVMFDVLHHIPQPREFFKEASRCLRPGGKIVMIEPANTLWGRFIYKNFHHEAFDTKADWNLVAGGPLSTGNGAIPWIILSRDRHIFESEFPTLKILRIRFHTPLRYLLSGGFTLKQLVPSFSYSLFGAIEFILSPLNALLGMFQTIELKKTR